MPKGVSAAQKKDGTAYYRAAVTYHGKHISLGGFATEDAASAACAEAEEILGVCTTASVDDLPALLTTLPFEKAVSLVNFRDNGLYSRNPIYLRKGYFSYYLSPTEELKFDIDDLFYYSGHKIQRRQGHLFVSDYGMQYAILARYGIRPYAVAGRDYVFVNGDPLDYRYANIRILSHYHGVRLAQQGGKKRYETFIHIKGDYKIGSYASETEAAIAYNKAVDFAKAAGILRNFAENYVDAVSPKEYAEIYTQVSVSEKYISYLQTTAGLCSSPARRSL